MRQSLWAGMVVWAMLAASCQVKEGPVGPLPPVMTPTSDAAMIPRTVIDAPAGQGGSADAAPAMTSDARGSADAAPRADARAPDARPDARADARDAASTCGLIQQNCPNKAQGCYPNDQRVLTCFPAGGVGELGPCLTHDQCLPGFLCLGREGGEFFCMRACDTRNPGCVACQPITTLMPYGYCSP
jgi:hypothetical protein